MAKASQIALRTEDATIDMQGIAIKIAYYPDRFSPHVMRQLGGMMVLQTLFLSMTALKDKSEEDVAQGLMQRLEDIETQLYSKTGDLAEIAATLLARWDLEEDMEECAPGAFVALTSERLVKFGFAFLSRLLTQLLAKMNLLGEVSGARQNGHSSATSGATSRRRR